MKVVSSQMTSTTKKDKGGRKENSNNKQIHQCNTTTTTTCTSIINVPFKTLIKQRKFQKILDIINKNEVDVVLEWLGLCNNQEEGKKHMKGNDSSYYRLDTPLHLCCTVQPPFKLVQVLLELCIMKRGYSKPEDAIDIFGKTPLHVAIINKCSPAIIGLLSQGCSAPLIQDSSSRLPLHWAVINSNNIMNGVVDDKNDNNNYTGIFRLFMLRNQNYNISSQQRNALYICQILLGVYPEAVLVKDTYGLTPLQMAIEPRTRSLLSYTTKMVNRGDNLGIISNVINKNGNINNVIDNEILNNNTSNTSRTKYSDSITSEIAKNNGIPTEIVTYSVIIKKNPIDDSEKHDQEKKQQQNNNNNEYHKEKKHSDIKQKHNNKKKKKEKDNIKNNDNNKKKSDYTQVSL